MKLPEYEVVRRTPDLWWIANDEGLLVTMQRNTDQEHFRIQFKYIMNDCYISMTPIASVLMPRLEIMTAPVAVTYEEARYMFDMNYPDDCLVFERDPDDLPNSIILSVLSKPHATQALLDRDQLLYALWQMEKD